MDIRSLRRPYEVRWARKAEWMPAMEMVWRTFLQHEGKEYPEEGVRHFFDFITGDELHEAFLRGEYRLMVAWTGTGSWARDLSGTGTTFPCCSWTMPSTAGASGAPSLESCAII